MLAESALAIPIPEADGLVGSFRGLYDPPAPTDIPAHVTVHYPYKPPLDITPQVISNLQKLLSQFPCFNVSFAKTGRFPGVLYISPVPAEPFRLLSEIIAYHFPESQPYDGEVFSFTPHLTFAIVSDPLKLDDIEAKFQAEAGNKLPILAEVQAVTMFENSSGNWQVRALFPLRSDR